MLHTVRELLCAPASRCSGLPNDWHHRPIACDTAILGAGIGPCFRHDFQQAGRQLEASSPSRPQSVNQSVSSVHPPTRRPYVFRTSQPTYRFRIGEHSRRLRRGWVLEGRKRRTVSQPTPTDYAHPTTNHTHQVRAGGALVGSPAFYEDRRDKPATSDYRTHTHTLTHTHPAAPSTRRRCPLPAFAAPAHTPCTSPHPSHRAGFGVWCCCARPLVNPSRSRALSPS